MDDVMTLSFDIVPADNAQNTDGVGTVVFYLK